MKLNVFKIEWRQGSATVVSSANFRFSSSGVQSTVGPKGLIDLLKKGFKRFFGSKQSPSPYTLKVTYMEIDKETKTKTEISKLEKTIKGSQDFEGFIGKLKGQYKNEIPSEQGEDEEKKASPSSSKAKMGS